ncbi:MAG: IS630 family transposase [Pseudomonadota bacterium]
MDGQTGAGTDQAAVRHRVQQHRLLGAAARPRVLAAEATEAGTAAQRAGDRHLEAQDVAGAKKNAKRQGRTIVFIDESGLSEKCPVTRTWGLRGRTPVIQQSFTWKQMSAIAGLSWWRFYFRFVDGAVRSEQIIEFLAALKRQIRRKLLIVWDGVGAHKSRRVRDWLEQQHGRIAIAFLPPYAPELNPVEAIWAYLKKHEIANLCPTHLAQISDFARRRLQSMQRRPKLIRAFWQQAELAL